MKNEELKQASKAAWARGLALLGVGGLVIALGIFAIWNLNLLAEIRAADPPNLKDTQAPAPADAPADADASGDEEAPTDVAPGDDASGDDASGDEDASADVVTSGDADASADVATSADVVTSADAVASGDERETFKTLLRAYDAEHGERIASPGFAEWDAQKQATLKAAREAAIDDFTMSDYAPAIDRIEALDREAGEALETFRAAFDTAMIEAETGLGAGDHKAALAAVQRALRLRAGDPEATALLEQINALPALLEALKRVDVARAEANPEAEIAAIEEVLTLDPARTDLAARRDELAAHIRETRFTAAIRAGLRHVEAGTIEPARAQLKIATSLNPGRDETRLLRDRIAAVERATATRSLLTKAAQQLKADQWAAALDSYKQVLALNPGDATALQGRDMAQNIVSMRARLEGYLANPARLSAANIRSQAEATLTRAAVPAALSPGLAKAVDRLTALVKLYMKEVAVRVLSDGKTAVAVRGVGHIGQTLDKVIRLKPGLYTFEGTRAGHVSKLVTLEVPAGTAMVEVTIVSDEPL